MKEQTKTTDGCQEPSVIYERKNKDDRIMVRNEELVYHSGINRLVRGARISTSTRWALGTSGRRARC